MSSVEAGKVSAVETGRMSAAETGQMSAVETRQMYSIKTGQRPVAIVDWVTVRGCGLGPEAGSRPLTWAPGVVRRRCLEPGARSFS